MSGAVLLDSVHLCARRVERAIVATIKTEAVTEHEAKALRLELAEAHAKSGGRVVVDLREVMLLASAGIGVLIELDKAVRAEGGKLAICNLSPEVGAMLKLTRLDKLLKIYPTLDKAVEKVG